MARLDVVGGHHVARRDRHGLADRQITDCYRAVTVYRVTGVLVDDQVRQIILYHHAGVRHVAVIGHRDRVVNCLAQAHRRAFRHVGALCHNQGGIQVRSFYCLRICGLVGVLDFLRCITLCQDYVLYLARLHIIRSHYITVRNGMIRIRLHVAQQQLAFRQRCGLAIHRHRLSNTRFAKHVVCHNHICTGNIAFVANGDLIDDGATVIVPRGRIGLADHALVQGQLSLGIFQFNGIVIGNRLTVDEFRSHVVYERAFQDIRFGDCVCCLCRSRLSCRNIREDNLAFLIGISQRHAGLFANDDRLGLIVDVLHGDREAHFFQAIFACRMRLVQNCIGIHRLWIITIRNFQQARYDSHSVVSSFFHVSVADDNRMLLTVGFVVAHQGLTLSAILTVHHIQADYVAVQQAAVLALALYRIFQPIRIGYRLFCPVIGVGLAVYRYFYGARDDRYRRFARCGCVPFQRCLELHRQNAFRYVRDRRALFQVVRLRCFVPVADLRSGYRRLRFHSVRRAVVYLHYVLRRYRQIRFVRLDREVAGRYRERIVRVGRFQFFLRFTDGQHIFMHSHRLISGIAPRHAQIDGSQFARHFAVQLRVSKRGIIVTVRLLRVRYRDRYRPPRDRYRRFARCGCVPF